MKRMIAIIIGWVAVLGLQAQVVESMRIYTDKDCYLAGEELWVKVCVTDSLFRESKISKVAYVEIGDTRQVFAQGKIELQDGSGWGRIRLPQNMHTGTYQLTGYTRYMRNRPSSCFPKKYIALLNTIQTTEGDEVELITDSAFIASTGRISASASLLTDKPVYGNRSKVTVRLSGLPADARELTLSVVRKDCKLSDLSLPDVGQKVANNTSGQHFIAECEGHIVTGRLVGAAADSINTRLSCVGKDIRVFDGQPQLDGTYAFYTTEVTGMREVVMTVIPVKETSCRPELVSPFAGILPEKLPKLRLAFQEDALIERSFGAQLHPLLPIDSVHHQGILEQLHDFIPASTYNLDEYVRFNTVREAIIEFVMGVRITTKDDKSIIRILQPDVRQFSNLKTLVLLDGVPIDNHNAILDYNARLLHYIHRYAGKYTFGGEVYDGIVSLITHRGTLPAMRLDDNSQMFSYEFPQNRPVFIAPAYRSDKPTDARIPDFRHTLYWNPGVTPATGTVSFYTSDMDGTYTVTLQGISSNGQELKFQNEFIVDSSY